MLNRNGHSIGHGRESVKLPGGRMCNRSVFTDSHCEERSDEAIFACDMHWQYLSLCAPKDCFAKFTLPALSEAEGSEANVPPMP
jgi:hypothetical protein